MSHRWIATQIRGRDGDDHWGLATPAMPPAVGSGDHSLRIRVREWRDLRRQPREASYVDATPHDRTSLARWSHPRAAWNFAVPRPHHRCPLSAALHPSTHYARCWTSRPHCARSPPSHDCARRSQCCNASLPLDRRIRGDGDHPDRARGTVWTHDGSVISDEIRALVTGITDSGQRAVFGHAVYEPIGAPPACAVLALRRRVHHRFRGRRDRPHRGAGRRRGRDAEPAAQRAPVNPAHHPIPG